MVADGGPRRDRRQLPRARTERSRLGKAVALWLAWHEEAAPHLKSAAIAFDEGKTQGRTPGQLQLLANKRDELLARQPPWDSMMAVVLEVWNLMGSCRHLGFSGAGPIPATSVYDWCDRQPWIDDELADLIVHAINQLDGERTMKLAAKAETKPLPRSKR